MRNHLLKFYTKLGYSIDKKKNDSTYFIKKSIEQDKNIKGNEEMER